MWFGRFGDADAIAAGSLAAKPSARRAAVRRAAGRQLRALAGPGPSPAEDRPVRPALVKPAITAFLAPRAAQLAGVFVVYVGLVAACGGRPAGFILGGAVLWSSLFAFAGRSGKAQATARRMPVPNQLHRVDPRSEGGVVIVMADVVPNRRR